MLKLNSLYANYSDHKNRVKRGLPRNFFTSSNPDMCGLGLYVTAARSHGTE